MAKVLIIDDDPNITEMLSSLIREMGHHPTCVHTLSEGTKEAADTGYDVVFLDVRMPDGSGLDLLPQLQRAPSHPEVIIMTGQGDPDGAELAIRSGAWDYLDKPSSIKAMMLPLMRALQYREQKKEKKPPVLLKRGGIIGRSPAMKTCLDLLAQAAASEASLLITGETGTGKELFAWAVHENSARAENNFVVVDCTALPATLVESTLFGHEKGAFTGADRSQDGLVKQADGGTLFLDEVGELPPPMQKTFLRVLQERRFRPVGGRKEVASDFRLIAATNRSLDPMAQAEQFRKDLLYRLRSLAIDLPPLRERREDLPELTMFHASRICERSGGGVKGFSPDFLDALAAYDWPGNVRELVSALESAIAAAFYEPALFSKHLPNYMRIHLVRKSFEEKISPPEAGPARQRFPRLREIRESVAHLEDQYLRDVVAHTAGDIQKACEISGLQRSRLYELLKKYHISFHPTPGSGKHSDSAGIFPSFPDKEDP